LQNQAKNSAFNHRFYNLFSDIFSGAVFKQAYRLGQLAKLQVGGCFANKSVSNKKVQKYLGQYGRFLPICAKDTTHFWSDVYKLGIKNSIQGTLNVRSVGQMRRKFLTTCTIKGTRGGNLQADVLQYGRSMIEMLGVLAIIGVLSVGGIAGYSKAMMKVKINKTINQVSQISANIRTLYASQKNYSGLNDTVIKKAKIISDDMIGASHSSISRNGYDIPETNTTNVFGGGFWVVPWISNDSWDLGSGFAIVLNGIPEDACMELLTLDWGSSAPGLTGIGLNYMSGTFNHGYHDTNGGAAENLPFPVSVAASYCSGNDNKMTFGFE
jgi:Tfp pilus assembly protein PilE